jgi:hypothetical protein
MVLRCDLMLASLLLFLAIAAAQKGGSNEATESHHGAGRQQAKAQEVEGKKAATGSESSNTVRRAARAPDFKVLVWYRKNDPLGTFKYEVYDVRKGEYTAAVETWVRNIEKNYPAYFVVARGVDLKQERGETEQLKVGSVIKRELMVAAAMSGVFVGGGGSLSPGPGLELNRTPATAPSVGSMNRPLGSAGIDRSYLNPPTTPFPVPVPYPRPHP